MTPHEELIKRITAEPERCQPVNSERLVSAHPIAKPHVPTEPVSGRVVHEMQKQLDVAIRERDEARERKDYGMRMSDGRYVTIFHNGDDPTVRIDGGNQESLLGFISCLTKERDEAQGREINWRSAAVDAQRALGEVAGKRWQAELDAMASRRAAGVRKCA